MSAPTDEVRGFDVKRPLATPSDTHPTREWKPSDPAWASAHLLAEGDPVAWHAKAVEFARRVNALEQRSAELATEGRPWSVAIRAVDSWHEMNSQGEQCECPGHTRIRKLREALQEPDHD